jgi:hypothetical protein
MPNLPFYNSKQNTVDPLIPVFMPQNSFGNGSNKKEISPKNPLGDLSWLIGK